MREKMFYRVNDDGNAVIFHKTGEPVTIMAYSDFSLCPVDSYISCNYRHPDGIVLTVEDAEKIGICEEAIMKSFYTIEVRRWFQKSNGNTYHSVEIIKHDNGSSSIIGKNNFVYGYEDQYLVTAAEMLHIDPREININPIVINFFMAPSF